jgi:Glucan phosphorylase
VAEIHTELLKTTIFKDFYEVFPNKFQNKTNGVTPRRWICCCNPDLAELYTQYLGTKDWKVDLDMIKKLNKEVDNPTFRKEWWEIKVKNKKRLAEWIVKHAGVVVNENSLFDVMVKRIHEYKRQLMNAFYIIHRYLKLKKMTPQEKAKTVPRTFIIGGKAAPGYLNAKRIIKLICAIQHTVNRDKETRELLKVVFLQNYNVSAAEVIIPAAELSQHISTAGTEASGTSNMKFCMNGCLILGTYDGANIEIAKEIGEENMFLFGAKVNEIQKLQAKVT